jgi:thiol-disulfide isomerase/thioredoxin
MTGNQTISTLLAHGVLVETDADGELAFGRDFLESVAERTEQVRRDAWSDAGLTRLAAYRDTFAAVAADSPRLLGTYWALDDALADVSFAELLRVLVVVDQLMHPPEKTAGAPDGFLPVRGDRVAGSSRLVRHGVIYVWREDCDPCDVMAGQFDELAADLTEDAVLLSTYGPDWARELNDAFAVAGAPTTLFLKNGAVDSRLVGPYESHIIAAELEATATAVE